MLNELRDILFIDIETVTMVENYNTLTERFKAQWARKAGFLKREEGVTDADIFHERAGIYAEFGKIIVIAVGKYVELEEGKIGLKTKFFAGSDEKAILQDFKSTLEKKNAGEWSSLTIVAKHSRKEIVGCPSP